MMLGALRRGRDTIRLKGCVYLRGEEDVAGEHSFRRGPSKQSCVYIMAAK